MARIRKLLALSEIRGEVEALEQRLDEVMEAEVDAIAVVGDLTAAWNEPDTYRSIFRALGKTERPCFWVPGPTDAPIGEYLRESYNIELVYPSLHGVHGTFGFGPGQVLFAGMGGEIGDDPETVRVEEARLCYPGWEVEYRLRFLRELKDYARVFLFTTIPAHKGLHGPGSETLAELIKTHNPRIVVVSGEHPTEERLGKSLIVSPGPIAEGHSAVIDFHDLSVEARVPAEQRTG